MGRIYGQKEVNCDYDFQFLKDVIRNASTNDVIIYNHKRYNHMQSLMIESYAITNDEVIK